MNKALRHHLNPLSLPWKFGGLALFEGDDDNKDDDKAGGGGGADDKKDDKDKKDDLPVSVMLKVDGKDVEMTMDELKANASKGLGADRKFEEASELRKQGEAGIRIGELSAKMQSGTAGQADVTEFVKLLGGDPEGMDMSQILGTSDDDKGKDKDKSASGNQGPITKEQLSPELQRQFDQAEEAELDRLRGKIEEDTRKVVDTDEVIGKMLDGLSDDDKKATQSELFEMAIERVRNQVFSGKLFGPTMLTETMQVIRARCKKLGIQTRSTPTPSAGPGSYGNEAGQQVQLPDKTPERKDSSDPDYIDNVVQRTLMNQQKLAMKSR